MIAAHSPPPAKRGFSLQVVRLCPIPLHWLHRCRMLSGISGSPPIAAALRIVSRRLRSPFLNRFSFGRPRGLFRLGGKHSSDMSSDDILASIALTLSL